MNEDLDELREALDMETYFQDEGVTFKATRGASGPQLNVKYCPECHNRAWKVYLHAETGLGNCFSCSAGFNKFSFIRSHLDNPTRADGKTDWAFVFNHVRQAVRQQGWRPKKLISAAVEHEKAQLPISFPLPTPEGQNLIYLENRGVTGELARYFHLRFCESGRWMFKKDDGTRGVQNFSNRIVIPIYDLEGEFVTFQGRDVTGTADRKYLFPMGLPGTGRYLYNGQNAIRAKRIVLGEGAFDVIAMKLAFDEESELRDVVPVGSFGKHLSAGDPEGNDQFSRLMKLKESGLEELTICWDGEAQALEAALGAAKKLAPTGLRVRIATLPLDKDPNEVPGDVMRQAFREARLYTPASAIQLRLRNPYRHACALRY